MNIGITGGCGFVGSNLAERFANVGHSVIALDNLMREGSHLNLQRLKSCKNFEFVRADIRYKEDLKILQRCDCILDCAAQTSVTEGEKELDFTFANNVSGLFNLLEIVRETRVPLVFCSTNKVYPSDRLNSLPRVEKELRFEWDTSSNEILNYTGLSVSTISQGKRVAIGINEDWPLGLGSRSIYGATKACADILCQEYKDAFRIPIFINRFSCIAGPWQFGMPAQGWYAWFIIAAYFGLPITYYGWSGKQVRDVVFIEDIYSLVEKQLQAATNGRSAGGVYNVGGGIHNTLSPREHFENIITAGLQPFVRDYTGEQRRSDHVIYISDIRKVQEEFNWSPNTDINTGFEECLRWVRENSTKLKQIFTTDHLNIHRPPKFNDHISGKDKKSYRNKS